ncbi:MAG: rod shape-determining protein MreC [Nocardioidaceae bacterium]
MRNDSGRSRAVIGLLLLACVTIITLDARHDTSTSPVDPLRTAVGDVLGPVEEGAASALRPLTGIPDHFRSVSHLRARNAALEAANQQLQTRLHAAQANGVRGAEVSTISAFADAEGYDVVQAQVIAIGSAQSFSRTVTIDAGTFDGVLPDLTVINANGLVGRVIESSATASTVLLAIDRDSTVGGRLSSTMELGFLDGTGDIGGDGSMTLSLVDHSVTPRPGDTVLTWGSRNEAPYLPGIPIGTVTSVHSSPAELTQTATVDPYVDFSSLDVVGVITSRAGSGGSVASGRGR